jgi:hypothetical protein
MDTAQTSLRPDRRAALITLIVANAAAILFFIFLGGSIVQALWIYWLQSVVIGAVNVVRIVKSPYVIKPAEVAGQPGADPSKLAGYAKFLKTFFVVFFCMHYGMFHFICGIFLVVFSIPDLPFTINGVETTLPFAHGGVGVWMVIASGLLFGVHHWLSFVDEQKFLREHPERVGRVITAVFRPYVRILPMHLIVVFGPMIALALNTAAVFVVFMVLKALADIVLFLFGAGHSHPART